MPDPEYVRIKITDIPAEFIEEYKLAGTDRDGWIYFEIRRGCYGLPQAGILANDLHAILLPRVVILCSPTSPRVSPLISSQLSSPKPISSFMFSTKSSARPPSGLHLSSSPMLPPSSMLPNQLLPIHWPTQVPSGVFPFLFTSSPLPPQTPTLWPTQVPSWVSFFFYCIIGLTSMLLPQGCVDPLVSGDGQTVSYQPHIRANTIRRYE